jgi:SAM-dependent methyltransferase
MPSLEGISLREIFRQKSIQRLKVAEINSAGTLHPFLAQSPNLCYSEFGSKMPGIADEDLMKLTYDDESFDLVITSETLEHVPDIDVALREIRRILKPDGMHIFTVPLVMDRATTKQRARIENDELIYLSPPSYHGGANEGKSDFLVFYEFGADFISRCERIGFEVVVKKDVSNPALIALITRKN